jgi:transcription initiation factor IIE alpha subunit
MGPIYLCPNCDWRVTLGMDFGMEGLPPCSVCNSQMDAIRIIKKDNK